MSWRGPGNRAEGISKGGVFVNRRALAKPAKTGHPQVYSRSGALGRATGQYPTAMTEAKEKLDAKIGAMVAASRPHRFITRRLFLYDFGYVFADHQDRGFEILNAICERFKLPFSTVKVAGSAHTGYSYFKERDFVPGESDLDVAIISATLFQEYSQAVYWSTHRYSDLTKFRRIEGVGVDKDFRYYLGSGQFRPDLMPEGSLKADWFGFFNKLSNKHVDLFRNINAGIYLSEGFFEVKTETIIEAYKKALP